MQKHSGGLASTQDCEMKDIDLAGFGRKYQKSICHLDMHAGYSLIWLKYQRIQTDQLDKDKYMTVKRHSCTHTHTPKQQKPVLSYLKPGCPYNTLMFVKS